MFLLKDKDYQVKLQMKLAPYNVQITSEQEDTETKRMGTNIQKNIHCYEEKMVWLAVNMRQNNLLGKITTRHRGHYIVLRIIIPNLNVFKTKN